LIIQLKKQSGANEISQIHDLLKSNQINYHFQDFNLQFVAPGFNNKDLLNSFHFIHQIIEIEEPYHLSSKLYKPKSGFEVNNLQIGSETLNLIAGPCSVESEEQINEVAKFLHSKNIKLIRGGAFKPRTSPYSFKGLETEGLKHLKNAAKKYNLTIVTELRDLSRLEEVYHHTDIIQVGARNMSNFSLLTELVMPSPLCWRFRFRFSTYKMFELKVQRKRSLILLRTLSLALNIFTTTRSCVD
jgi:3-deoxy-7-phosphoheptulonate synthase